MEITLRLSLMTSFLLIFTFISQVYAQAAGSTTEQQELDQVMEMMKQSGMDPKQMKQMEGLFKNMSEMENKRKAAQANKAKIEFESATASHGTAQVEVEGKQYALTITKCEVKDSQNAAFVIKASQAPGMDQGELSFHSDGINLNNSFNFSTQSATSKYYSATNTTFEFNGQSLAWQGIVETNSGKVPLKLNLSCGGEAYQSKELAKHQKKYSKEVLEALPPNKMIEVMDASQKEMSASMDRAESMRFPEAASRGGAITINGKNILFRGPAMDTNDADRAPEFQDISETPELFVTCGV